MKNRALPDSKDIPPHLLDPSHPANPKNVIPNPPPSTKWQRPTHTPDPSPTTHTTNPHWQCSTYPRPKTYRAIPSSIPPRQPKSKKTASVPAPTPSFTPSKPTPTHQVYEWMPTYTGGLVTMLILFPSLSQVTALLMLYHNIAWDTKHIPRLWIAWSCVFQYSRLPADTNDSSNLLPTLFDAPCRSPRPLTAYSDNLCYQDSLSWYYSGGHVDLAEK